MSQELSQVCYGDEALWEAGSRYLRTQARKSLVRILGAFCQAPSRTKTNPGSGSNASRSSSGQPGNSLLQKCTRADGIRADSIRSPCVRMIHNADSLWVKSGRTPPLWRYRVHKDEGGLQGQQDYLLLPISATDKRRFYYYFQEKNTPNIERFFVFDSSEYRYALNMREVVFHQFLSEGLRPIVDEEDDAYKDDYFNVHITLVNGGLVIPLSVEPDAPQNEETDDIGQLNAFFDTLDCEPETTDRFMITDEDGEDAFIRIGSIAMVRVALDALEPVEDDEE